MRQRELKGRTSQLEAQIEHPSVCVVTCRVFCVGQVRQRELKGRTSQLEAQIDHPSVCVVTCRVFCVRQVRQRELKGRTSQLEAQIDHLKTESLGFLKQRIAELGIEANKPEELIVKAKEIVMKHRDLQERTAAMETEVGVCPSTYSVVVRSLFVFV